MQPGHRPRSDGASTTRKAASLDEVESLVQFFYKLWNLKKIVAVVSVPHDDEAPKRRLNSTHQSAAIARLKNVDDTRTLAFGDFPGRVSAAIVRYEYFSGNMIFPQSTLSFLNAASERVLLIKTRDDHRDFDGFRLCFGLHEFGLSCFSSSIESPDESRRPAFSLLSFAPEQVRNASFLKPGVEIGSRGLIRRIGRFDLQRLRQISFSLRGILMLQGNVVFHVVCETRQEPVLDHVGENFVGLVKAFESKKGVSVIAPIIFTGSSFSRENGKQLGRSGIIARDHTHTRQTGEGKDAVWRPGEGTLCLF